MARTTVADVLIDGLARAGAARVFAAPGGPVALADAARRRPLEIVEAPDAMAAGVLAAVSGEVSDAPGVAFAGFADTPGLVRGLAHAQRDRAPLIVVTPAREDGGLLAPVVKASVVVEVSSAAHWIAHAAQLAMTDPRGPVHLVLADDVAGHATLPVATSCRPAPLPPPDSASLDAFAAVIATVNRPLLVTGVECRGHDARWIRSFAETLPAPVLATAKGKGALADPHPLALGSLTADHPALARADLVILLGVDAGELSPSAVPTGMRVVRIGRAPWPGGDFAAEVHGDLALVIEELAPQVRARPAADWDVAELDRIKRAVVQAAQTTASGRLVTLAREATPAGTLATGDVPALTAWQAVGPREALSPLGMVTPGYAVLAAIATQLANPERRVVAFTSTLGVTAGERALRLARALRLPLIVVALDAVVGGEHAFAASFSRAFLERRLAVLGGDGPWATPTPDS